MLVLAAAGYVSCWDYSPDDVKAEKPPVPPMRAWMCWGLGGDIAL